MSMGEPAGDQMELPSSLSRHHAAGASSARGILLTVLGEFLLGSDGPAWTSALVGVLGQLGVEEKAARQALLRTADDGWVTAERLGRRARWHLTPAATEMLTEGARRIYSFTGPDDNWDGHWLLLYARVPEKDRKGRHILRSRLSWAGFGTLGPHLWVSTHPEREAEARQALCDAGAADDAHLFIATRPGVGDLRTMVSEAWDLAAVQGEYENFLEEFGVARSDHLLARQIALVHAWRRFPAIDPALPRELLPTRWSGAAAADLFAFRHAQWAGMARAEWLRLNAEAS
ncbi:MAG: PaaX family transcriptional regulator [Actinomycetota bacterium]|nr:PaaX family transcriptional regulator [Actinomycetota bacterium]